ncbi:MAG: exo-beta-N-acetylmuramidase NamZ family protein [Aequorivita sp.]
MGLTFFKNTFLLLVLIAFSCGSSLQKKEKREASKEKQDTRLRIQDVKIIVGAEQFQLYSDLLKDKNVGVVANQTSFLEKENQHLVDFLISKKVSVKKVFAPEHGFRGTADAGEHVKDGVDAKTGVPLISLYGSNKKPSQEQLKGLDVVIFDIQDVGARFYTYISTLHYVMEACAEAGIPVIVMDRPNPNGHYIDGPILEKENQSFVGMHPIPIVHGMTMGEYAQMINGEGWLKDKAKCKLSVIKMKNYTHKTAYSLPIKPSPNLPNDKSINLYPSLCFFEGTFINAGRGTDMQFQVFGAPSLPASEYTFEYTPESNEGAKNPKFKDELCHGKDLRKEPRLSKINLEWLINAYNANGNLSEGKAGKIDFFNSFFVKLAGTKKLQQQIEQGMSAEAIRDSWKEGLADFEQIREKYLLYE